MYDTDYCACVFAQTRRQTWFSKPADLVRLLIVLEARGRRPAGAINTIRTPDQSHL
jgi:hypothetical protein